MIFQTYQVRNTIQNWEHIIPEAILPHASGDFQPMTTQSLEKSADCWVPYLNKKNKVVC